MRWFKVLLATMVGSLGAATALAEQAASGSGFYTRFDTGPSFSDGSGGTLGTDLGTAGIAGVGLGYRFSPNFRSDFTLGYRGGYSIGGTSGPGFNVGGTDASALTGMVNGYVDLGTYGRFTPYIGAGLGFSRNEIDTIRGNVGGTVLQLQGDDHTGFAWQTSAGTAVDLGRGLALDLGYRYADLGLVRTHAGNLGAVGLDAADGHLRGHEVQLGLRYQY